MRWLLVVAALAGCRSPEDSDAGDTDGPACTDLDCDGWPDLVFTSGDVDGASARVYWGGPDRYEGLRYSDLPDTSMTKSVALVDLDLDGDLDVVLSRLQDQEGRLETGSLLLYTTGLDPWTYDVETLPTSGAHQALAADFDADGWPDLWFSNHLNDAHEHVISSYLYWGGPDGFSEQARSEIGTSGAFGASAADLDQDGSLDLVVSNYFDGTERVQDSMVVWGDGERFATNSRTPLETIGARANIPYDIDQDGWLDVLFVNHYDGTTMDVPSYVFWGGPEGLSEARRLSLKSMGPHSASLGDFDANGTVDLVFSNQRTDPKWEGTLESEVHLGGGGRDLSSATSYFLDTNAAAGQVLGDLDHDGWLDLVFANFARGVPPPESYVYWGSPEGFSTRTALPTEHADGVAAYVGEAGF